MWASRNSREPNSPAPRSSSSVGWAPCLQRWVGGGEGQGGGGRGGRHEQPRSLAAIFQSPVPPLSYSLDPRSTIPPHMRKIKKPPSPCPTSQIKDPPSPCPTSQILHPHTPDPRSQILYLHTSDPRSKIVSPISHIQDSRSKITPPHISDPRSTNIQAGHHPPSCPMSPPPHTHAPQQPPPLVVCQVVGVTPQALQAQAQQRGGGVGMGPVVWARCHMPFMAPSAPAIAPYCLALTPHLFPPPPPYLCQQHTTSQPHPHTRRSQQSARKQEQQLGRGGGGGRWGGGAGMGHRTLMMKTRGGRGCVRVCVCVCEEHMVI